MAGQYSHKQFFRRLPNQQLVDYFRRREVALPEDVDKWKETNVEAFFGVFDGLSEDLQGVIEAQFQEVDSMACEGGIQALIDEMADVTIFTTDFTLASTVKFYGIGR